MAHYHVTATDGLDLWTVSPALINSNPDPIAGRLWLSYDQIMVVFDILSRRLVQLHPREDPNRKHCGDQIDFADGEATHE
jgi:hypothetical protein